MSASYVKVERGADGVAVLTIDDPTEPVNTLRPELDAELGPALEALANDPEVAAVVIASGKPASFVVGANLDFLRSIDRADVAEAESRKAAERFARLAALGKPVVAAVHGPALGGGFELALACTSVVASDDPATVLGLPEVKLGLLPAANGMLRLADKTDLRLAMDLALTGRNLRPKKAKQVGLVDVVAPPAYLLDAARKRAEGLAAARRTAHATGGRDAGAPQGLKARLTELLVDKTPVGRAVLFKKARAELRKTTGGHYPAPERILDVLEIYAKKGFAAAADAEAKAFGELVPSEVSRALVGLFFAEREAKKDTGLEPGERAEPRAVAQVGVVGAGLMGAGVAYVTAQKAKTPVRLVDRDDAGVGRGLRQIRELEDGRVRRRRATPVERDAVLARVAGGTGLAGLAHADVVVEAVFEDLALKRKVLADVEAKAPGALFATNTSSLPVADIAAEAARPGDVVGMHYFSPVQKMPLLEVVRGPATSAEAVATAVALGRRQGKTVIVVKDGPGFYTTRILAPYLNEAAHAVAEGVAIDRLDRALVAAGFPVGPVQLMDEVGIDVGAHVTEVLEAAFGARMKGPKAFAALARDDRKGRKNGRGFYLYEHGTTKGTRKVDDTIYAVLGVAPTSREPDEVLVERLVLAFVNEALRCLGEGIVRSPRDADLGAVFGLGFPPFWGGPARWVDREGATSVLERTKALEARFGARFAPAPLLEELARSGAKLRA